MLKLGEDYKTKVYVDNTYQGHENEIIGITIDSLNNSNRAVITIRYQFEDKIKQSIFKVEDSENNEFQMTKKQFVYNESVWNEITFTGIIENFKKNNYFFYYNNKNDSNKRTINGSYIKRVL